MTTAEGGMLVSKKENTTKEIAHFRAFSVDRTFSERKIPGVYDVTGVGLNYRMSELQAALGCAQVQKLPLNLSIRKNNFLELKEELLKIKHIDCVLDSKNSDSINSYYCLVVILDDVVRDKRNDIIFALTEKGIGSSVYYPQPVPRMKYYDEKYHANPNDYKNAAIISDGSIALPVGPHLGSVEMNKIADCLSEVLGKY
jgi:dTDP-4-amino-4,6-dideoxygalactose transaminase